MLHPTKPDFVRDENRRFVSCTSARPTTPPIPAGENDSTRDEQERGVLSTRPTLAVTFTRGKRNSSRNFQLITAAFNIGRGAGGGRFVHNFVHYLLLQVKGGLFYFSPRKAHLHIQGRVVWFFPCAS